MERHWSPSSLQGHCSNSYLEFEFICAEKILHRHAEYCLADCVVHTVSAFSIFMSDAPRNVFFALGASRSFRSCCKPTDATPKCPT
jgi:hypothetical protein